MKKYFKTFFAINKAFLEFRSFVLGVIAIFLIQFIYNQGWLKNKNRNSLNIGWFVIALSLLLFVDWIYNSKFYSFKNINKITPLDVFLYGGCLVFFATWCIFRCIGLDCHANSAWLILCFVFGLLISIRVYLIKKENNIKDENSLLELKDLNKVQSWTSNKGPLLVNERAATYDLLDRGNIEKILLNAIEASSLKHSYVIGVVGEWGSGKTTLLNLVKKDPERGNLVFMHSPGTKDEDFDIWLFGSQWALIKGIYDTILNGLSIHYYSFLNEKFLHSISQVAVEIPKFGNVLSSLLTDKQAYEDIVKLKSKLSDYILSTEKHYVLCVDNLDRANDEQVILLLKLISTVFDLPHITYVLLYSESRMRKILNETTVVNNSYLDKVVNLEIEMPRDFNRQKCEFWLQNLLLTYGVPAEKLKSYDFILNFIVNNISDIRNLKRVINSTFSIMAISKTLRLNLPQVLAIQYIYFSNSKLYEEIKSHENMFTFEDTYGPYGLDKKELNNEDNKYFKDICQNYAKYKILLMGLFPKFKKFIQGNYYIENYLQTKYNLKKASINTRKYFRNYFYLAESDHVVINAHVKSFIKMVNSGKDIKKKWLKEFIFIDSDTREKLLAELNLFMESNDIPDSRLREKLAEVIFNSCIDQKNNTNLSDFDKLRLEGMISELIGETSRRDFYKFMDRIKDEYSALKLISYMNKDFTKRLGGRSYNLESNKKRMNQVYNNILRKIYEEKIDLFDNKFYRYGNANVLYEFLHKNNLSISGYLNIVVKDSNAYKVMFDVISIIPKNETTIGYSFSKKRLDYIDFDKVPTLVNLLDKNTAKTISQEKVLKVLKEYQKGDENPIYFEEPIDENKL